MILPQDGYWNDRPLVTAVICTHNRAGRLRRAIASLLTQSLSAAKYDILVVDNASSDNTRAVAAEFAGRTVPVNYCLESRVGVAHARNRALIESMAPIVAYIDDDSRADAAWLENLLNGFLRESHRPICVGGRIALDWEADRPGWLPDAAIWGLGYVDHGPRSRRCQFPRETLFGTNLAFERQFLLDVGGFDTQLGREGRNLRGGEEIEMEWRLHRLGGWVQYEPAALVYHSVPKERLKVSWFARRAFGQGASVPLIDDRYGVPSSSTSREQQSATLPLAGRLLVWIWWVVKAHDSQTAFRFMTAVAYRMGRLSWHLRQMLKRDRASENA